MGAFIWDLDMAYDYDPEDKFGYKDTLPENHPEKVITGVEFDEEFKKIELAVQGLQNTIDGQLDLVTSSYVMGGTYSLVDGLVVRSLKPALVEGQPLPAPADCPDTFLICIDDGPFEGEDLVRSDWIVSSVTANAWIPLPYSRQDAVVGEPGKPGTNGKGWIGGNYNPSNGIVTFLSDDGLTFTTTDIRGEDGRHGDHGVNGKGWTSGSYSDQTGVVTFISDDGLGFATGDLRGEDGRHGDHGIHGKGWTSGSYDDNTGIVTFTSDDGLGFVTSDIRGKNGDNGTGIVNSLDGVGPDESGDLTEVDPTVPQHVKNITEEQINDWNGGGGAVDSVNGKTGVVVLNYSDVGAQVAGSYATSSHNHNGVYAPASHSHSGYAPTSHNHNGVYQPVGSYAASNHNHNGVYAPVNHTHSGSGFSGTYTASTSAIFTMTGSDKSAFTVVSTTSARGCELKLQGNSVNNTQHVRAHAEHLEVVNGPYGAVTWRLDAAGNMTSTGDVRAYSDERLKENIDVVSTGLLDQVRGVEFNWKKDGARSSGVIAQDIQKVFPHLVSESIGTDPEDQEESTLTVNYAGLTAYLIEELKECRQRIKALEEAK